MLEWRAAEQISTLKAGLQINPSDAIHVRCVPLGWALGSQANVKIKMKVTHQVTHGLKHYFAVMLLVCGSQHAVPRVKVEIILRNDPHPNGVNAPRICRWL